jgi:protein-L-isoaspartate(D-aspartate) O-methyltransferase
MAECAQATAVLRSRLGSQRTLGIVLSLALVFPALGAADPDYRGLSQEMIREIEHQVQLAVLSGLDRPIQQRVLEAMGKVSRHELVTMELRVAAYDNRPLPIGYGQTIR